MGGQRFTTIRVDPLLAKTTHFKAAPVKHTPRNRTRQESPLPGHHAQAWPREWWEWVVRTQTNSSSRPSEEWWEMGGIGLEITEGSTRVVLGQY